MGLLSVAGQGRGDFVVNPFGSQFHVLIRIYHGKNRWKSKTFYNGRRRYRRVGVCVKGKGGASSITSTCGYVRVGYEMEAFEGETGYDHCGRPT